MSIVLKVNYHLSGRLTLSKGEDGVFQFTDYPTNSGLFGNQDAASFYQKLAHEILRLVNEEGQTVYLDDAGDISKR